jgi:hypothetical protein
MSSQEVEDVAEFANVLLAKVADLAQDPDNGELLGSMQNIL